MKEKIDNNFTVVHDIKSINFHTEKGKICIKSKNIFDKNVEVFGFFLANMLAYQHNDDRGEYSRVISINKLDDIYTLESQSDLELDVLFPNQSVVGNGTVFKLENGVEIFYKETSRNNNYKYHYRFIIEELDNEGKLLEIINCKNREIVECYLVDDLFKINNFSSKKLAGTGFKTYFKTR